MKAHLLLPAAILAGALGAPIGTLPEETSMVQQMTPAAVLERAYEERSTVLAYLLIDPRLAPLRDDSRCLALARRLRGG